jgi:hypothetical protein
MLTMELLVSLDDAHARRIEGPDYDGPQDQPVWALRLVEATNEDWEMTLLGEGLTVSGAHELAVELGYGDLRYLD